MNKGPREAETSQGAVIFRRIYQFISNIDTSGRCEKGRLED